MLRLRGKRTEIGEHQLQIRFLDARGNELLGGEGTVRFGEPPAGITDVEAAAVLVFDVPLPGPGAYRFELTMNGTRTIDVPLTASLAAGAPGQN